MLFASSEDLSRAVQRGSHFFRSNAFKTSSLPRWEHIIENLDTHSEDVTWLKDGGGLCTRINERQPGLFWLSRLQQEVDKNFKFDGIETTGHLYFSLTNKGETFGIHKDTCNVFFCGIIGHTVVNVYGKVADGSFRPYRVGPGDLLFIPKGVFHGTEPMGPRVSLSIGVEYGT